MARGWRRWRHARVALEADAESATPRRGDAPRDVAKADKVELLRRADEAARRRAASIVQVSAGYGDSRRRILVANSDGLLVERRPGAHAFLVFSAWRRVTPGCRPATRRRVHASASSSSTTIAVEEAAEQPPGGRWRSCPRGPAPSGVLPVVHQERVGRHPVPRGVRARARGRPHREGQLGVHRAASARSVASPLRHAGRRRHIRLASGAASAIDDEGRPTQRNVLIENGVLTDYMWDYLRARKEGRTSSGNGRRQSYQHLPMVRMTNTFLLAGDEEPDEIVAQTPTRCLRRAARRRTGEHRDRRLRLRDDRGLPDRERPASPSRSATPISSATAPTCSAQDRRHRQRLRHVPGHLRQGRPKRAGRLRAADAAGDAA